MALVAAAEAAEEIENPTDAAQTDAVGFSVSSAASAAAISATNPAGGACGQAAIHLHSAKSSHQQSDLKHTLLFL